MRSWMIAFSLGVFVCGFIPLIPDSPLLYLFLLLPLLFLRIYSLRPVGAFCVGIFWFLLMAQTGLDKLLPQALEGKDIWVQGSIVSLPQKAERSQRFEFWVETLCPETDIRLCDFSGLENKPHKILLNLYEPLFLRPGEQWQLKVRLKRPHGFSNPGGFDYEAWLFQNRISATGYIRSDPENRLLRKNSSLFSFQNLRFDFRERLQNIKGLENIGLIKALTIGDRYNITDKEWDVFTATGTNHLIVISGLHVGLVALLSYRLALFVFSFFAPLLLTIPAKRFASLAAIAGACLYAGLAGFSLPAQRAFIMVAVFMLGQCLYRHTAVLNTYCLALALVLARDPMAPQNSGFWLSFGAVGVLILFAQKESARSGAANTAYRKSLFLLKTQGFLFIGLFPLMLIFFQQVSLLAPLVNIVAIPFVSLFIVPLCLLGLVCIGYMPGLARVLFQLADFLLIVFKDSLSLILEYSSFSLISLPALNWFGILALLTGIAFLLFLPVRSLRSGFIKAMSIFCFLPLLISNKELLEEGEFTLDVLDVGQGLAIVISTRNHSLIYDAGPAYSPGFNAGSGLLLPFIASQNIPTIETIIISHGDNDHSGGLTALIKSYPQVSYLSSDSDLFRSEMDANLCRKGQSWIWNWVHFEILHPDQEVYESNNASCVLKVSSGEYSVLLSGDIESRAERALVRADVGKLKADILLAPHHGSLTSSTAAFLEAVAPDYVIFSSGYLNRFNHPHPKVQARYSTLGVKSLNTSETGAISFHISSEEGISEPVSYRMRRKRYWSSI